MSDFWEQYRDPRWQRKRLEIMQRDRFKCVLCLADDKTLNVHHTYYAKGRKPWEYEDDSLRTLCEPCHALTSKHINELKRLAGAMDEAMLQNLLGFARGLAALDGNTPEERLVAVEDFGIAGGLGALFCLNWSVVFENASARGGTIDIDSLREWGMKNWKHIRDQGAP